MSEFDYDLFVIGGGSGGVRAGRVAASMGHKVGIAEEYRYGGTCVIRGCVPKKLMVYASHFHESFEDAKGFGWQVGESKFDWSTLIANKDREIDRLEGLYRKGLSNAQADIFDTRAVLESNNEIRLIKYDRIVSAKRIMIAVGGTPSRLEEMPGSEFCIASDEVFHLEKQPKSIVIVGGGYIAVEFACIFAGLGTKTTLVYRGDKILRGFDNDLRESLREEMVKKGIQVILENVPECVSPAEPEKFDEALEVKLSDGRLIPADQVMLAVGRKPLTKQLGLERAGVQCKPTGHIVVDAYSKTTVDNIWAVGDVSDRVPLTPVAIHESMCFIETEYKNNPTIPDHDLIATAVFSQPEIGTVGLSEEQAIAMYDKLNVFVSKFRAMKHTLSGRDEKTLMKIIVCAKTDLVVGVHLLGEASGEMSQLLAIALKSGVTKKDFDRTMAVHPTAAEELVTMYQPTYQIAGGQRVG
ncbi:MAG: glutathione-disulfide reductase [Hyphomicrobiales bacterium]|nr:glutathione-disulfide reductase [Hyphomicrobiales bacterium]